VRLFEKEAPLTVRNFADLALARKDWRDPLTSQIGRRPLYDGTTFHRVIDNFIIQGGDPKGDGTGDAGFTLRDEFVPALKFDVPGRLAMANRGPGTADCQFFITLVPTPTLDGKNTIFGQVVAGMDTVTRIAKVPTDKEDRPVKPIKILKITFHRERALAPLAGGTPAATRTEMAKQ
jgi:peptidyl-prolyl cis-trans isomerase A (cyclophilin A)